MGAAGALEAGICGYALKRGVLPPTLNLDETDIDFGFNLIPKTSVQKEVEYALSNSFGFGGVNVSLLFRKINCLCLLAMVYRSRFGTENDCLCPVPSLTHVTWKLGKAFHCFGTLSCTLSNHSHFPFPVSFVRFV